MTTTIEKLVEYIPEATIAIFPPAVALFVENLSDDIIGSGIGQMTEANFGRLKHNLEYWALLGTSAVGNLKLWIHTIVIFHKLEPIWAGCLLIACIVFLAAMIILFNRGPGQWANPVDTPKWVKWIWSLVPLAALATDALANLAKV